MLVDVQRAGINRIYTTVPTSRNSRRKSRVNEANSAGRRAAWGLCASKNDTARSWLLRLAQFCESSGFQRMQNVVERRELSGGVAHKRRRAVKRDHGGRYLSGDVQYGARGV